MPHDRHDAPTTDGSLEADLEESLQNLATQGGTLVGLGGEPMTGSRRSRKRVIIRKAEGANPDTRHTAPETPEAKSDSAETPEKHEEPVEPEAPKADGSSTETPAVDPPLSPVESDPAFQAVAAAVRDTPPADQPEPVSKTVMDDAPPQDQLQALPDAGPNGPKQITGPGANPPKPPTAPTTRPTTTENPTVVRRTRIVAAVLLAVITALLFGLWAYGNDDATNAAAPVPVQKVYNKANCPNAARVTAQTLAVYTDGKQTDVKNYVPTQKDQMVLACSTTPPPPGTKKNTFDVSACVVCPK